MRGKLLPRDRIETLTDEDSPFLEIGGWLQVYDDDVLAAGVIAGIGRLRRRVHDCRERCDRGGGSTIR